MLVLKSQQMTRFMANLRAGKVVDCHDRRACRHVLVGSLPIIQVQYDVIALRCPGMNSTFAPKAHSFIPSKETACSAAVTFVVNT